MSIDTYPPQSTQATVLRTDSIAPYGWMTGNLLPQGATWPDSIISERSFFWCVPESYAGGDLTFRVRRRVQGGVAGNAVMTSTITRQRVGLPFTSIESVVSIDFGPGNNLSYDTTRIVSAAQIVVGDTLLFNIARDGTAGGDTLAGIIAFDGASITYNAYVMGYAAYPASVNNASYEEGTFTVTATGFSGTAPSRTVDYVRIGKHVTLYIPVLNGTSNATTFTFTLPAAFAAKATFFQPVLVQDNGSHLPGMLTVNGVNCSCAVSAVTAFTASGIKQLNHTTLAYITI